MTISSFNHIDTTLPWGRVGFGERCVWAWVSGSWKKWKRKKRGRYSLMGRILSLGFYTPSVCCGVSTEHSRRRVRPIPGSGNLPCATGGRSGAQGEQAALVRAGAPAGRTPERFQWVRGRLQEWVHWGGGADVIIRLEPETTHQGLRMTRPRKCNF